MCALVVVYVLCGQLVVRVVLYAGGDVDDTQWGDQVGRPVLVHVSLAGYDVCGAVEVSAGTGLGEVEVVYTEAVTVDCVDLGDVYGLFAGCPRWCGVGECVSEVEEAGRVEMSGGRGGRHWMERVMRQVGCDVSSYQQCATSL